jgi:hypothetical protein
MFDLNTLFDEGELELFLSQEQQRGGNPNYSLIKTTEKVNNNFGLQQTTFTFSIDNNQLQRSLFEAETNFNEFIVSFYENHIRTLSNNCKIKLLITHPSFDIPINTNYIIKSQFTPEIIHKQLYNVVQSRKRTQKLLLTDNDIMQIILSVAYTINGSGKRKVPLEEILNTNYISYKKTKSLRDHCNRMPYMIAIKEDNYCLIRSILLGKLYHENVEEFNKRKKLGDILFTRQVQKYAIKLDLPDRDYGLDLDHTRIIEADIGYQIIMYQNKSKNESPIYWNRDKNHLKKIYIHYNSHEHHFSLIKHIRSFFGNNYFCESCQQIYYNINSHYCAATCESCRRMKCEKEFEEKCQCKAILNNEKCKIYHEQICKVKRKCSTCTGLIPVRRKHVCINQKFCSNCSDVVHIDHMCYIKKVESKSKVKFNGLGFFDFEAYESLDGTHVVNLAMAKRVCLACYNGAPTCNMCDYKYKFENIADFVSWLKAEGNKNFIWFAHNAKGYDSQFVLNELYNNTLPNDPKISVITNGAKILEIRYKTFIIRDSACFLPMPLAQFPKAFNLKEMKKGNYLNI